MPYNPSFHHRRSIRLPGYDYRNGGGYFVTIVTHERAPLFDDLTLRRVAEFYWEQTSRTSQQVVVDDYVVMPNHLHGILVFTSTMLDQVEQPPCDPISSGSLSGSLGAVVGSFKSQTARRINQIRKAAGAPVWQRNYHEHIIRNERELSAIRQYIHDNPLNWAKDPENSM